MENRYFKRQGERQVQEYRWPHCMRLYIYDTGCQGKRNAAQHPFLTTKKVEKNGEQYVSQQCSGQSYVCCIYKK